MVDKEQQGGNDISDYVQSRGIFIAKKEKQEWQNILGKVALNPKMKKWVKEIIANRYRGV